MFCSFFKKNLRKIVSYMVLGTIGISILPVESVHALNKDENNEKIIDQYINGVKMLPEQIEARKKKVKELGLEKYVDNRYFLTDEWYDGRSEADINELGVNILVDTVTEEELEAWSNNLKDGISMYKVTNYEMVSYGGSTVGKYEVDGRMAFCAQHSATSPAKGSPTSNKKEVKNDKIRKVLFYGYGGPKKLSDMKGNYGWVMTSLGLSYANTGKGGPKAKAFVDRVNKLAKPPSSFKVYVVDTNGGRTQDLMYWNYTPKGKLSLQKFSANPSMTNGNNCYSLSGAVYGVYKNSNATNKVAELKTNASGKSNTISLNEGSYYIKELKSPTGYALDKKIYKVKVNSEKTTIFKCKDIPQSDPIGILLRKVDSSTGESRPIDGASLAEARFSVKYYKGRYNDNIDPETLGKKPDCTWVFKTDSDGFSYFSEEYKVSGSAFWYNGSKEPTLPQGTVTIQEIVPPKGYKINPEVFVRRITSQGYAENVSTYNEPIVKEEVIKGRVKVKKVDEETGKGLAGAKFEIRDKKSGKVLETITTNGSGEAITREYTFGKEIILKEVKAPDKYILNGKEYFVTIDKEKTVEIKISNKSETLPFKIKVIKTNEKNTVLEGAEFRLYSDKNCKNEIGKAISNANGELEFRNLEVGKQYYFKEIKAPNGYRIPVDSNGKPHVYEVVVTKNNWVTGEFKVNVDGKQYTQNSTKGNIQVGGGVRDRIVSIKVVNYTNIKLPATGSKAMIPLLMAGISFIGVAFILNKKRGR